MRVAAVTAGATAVIVLAGTARAGVRIERDVIAPHEATTVVFTAPRTVTQHDDHYWYTVVARRRPRISTEHSCHDSYRLGNVERDIRKGERVRVRLPRSRIRWCSGTYVGAVQIWEMDYSGCLPDDKCNPDQTLADQVGRFSFRVRG